MNESQLSEYILVVTKGEDKGKVFELHLGDNLIGRWDTDSACFPEIDLEEIDRDFKVSRRHAVLDIDKDTITLTDAGSLNGSKVNGQKLEAEESVPVKQGDQISIGNLEFVLQKAGS